MAKRKNDERKISARAEEMRGELIRKIVSHIGVEGAQATAVSGLGLYRRSSPTACTSAAYMPTLIVFVQGQKRIVVGRTTYLCDGGTFLLTSVDLPVVSQVIDATPEKPILGVVLKLEMAVVREILSQEEFHFSEGASDARGMAVGRTSAELLGACSRLLDLLDTPEDIPFLSGLIQREIIYRLVCSAAGD